MIQVSMYCGVQIVPTRTVPRKQHHWKPTMKMSYHKRIQKKWLKRYGVKQVHAYPIAESTVF